MNNLYDVLEICLQELENGADMETVLARYPDLARELRPILKASNNARIKSITITDPSPDVVRRGRAKVLQHASEMREQKIAPRRRRLPIIQRLAISLTLAALFLASGTGLVGASSTALPGENLYPIKLTWENLRLFFTFDRAAHELLEHGFKNERLQEISELLAVGRQETIQFSGIFMDVNGRTYVAGIRIVILDSTILPAGPLLNGAPVAIMGRTNAGGFVEAESITLLPVGTIVPLGDFLEIEIDIDQNENDTGSDSENDNSNESVNENSSNDNNANGEGSDNDNNNDNGNDNNSNDGNDKSDDNNDNDGNSGKDNGNGDDNHNDDSSGKDDDDSGGGGDNGDD